MGIQAWFIILGVISMTLIVWDGKRLKAKERLSNHTANRQHASAIHASLPASVPYLAFSHPAAKPAVVPIAKPEPKRIREGSLIGAATQISGKLIADEPVLVKGRLEGTLLAPNHPVTITSTGYVTSYVEGDCVDIDGHLAGTLRANKKATLLSRARLQGAIEAPCLECAAGAWLQVDVAKKASRPKVAMVS
ncbi:bactofilin family protein [Vreelandella sulfidaeris]|uniref:bactofilin family protein n=1 Tax=Vreelandella sulfidaeris TaxID=115553 RepID=UPI0035E6BEDB